MLDEDLILILTGSAAGMSMRDISELMDIKTCKEYYDPVLMSIGPVAEMSMHDILELMHTKMHTENEDRSNYWPIKGFIRRVRLPSSAPERGLQA